MKAFRQNSLYISDEILWYANLEAKALSLGTDAQMSADQICENRLRESFVRDNPNLPLLWEKHCAIRQASKKSHEALEKEAMEAIGK